MVSGVLKRLLIAFHCTVSAYRETDMLRSSSSHMKDLTVTSNYFVWKRPVKKSLLAQPL
jgi:hypothetical protein